MCKSELFIFRWRFPHGFNNTIIKFRVKSGRQLQLMSKNCITIQKQTNVAYFKVQSLHFPGENEEAVICWKSLLRFRSNPQLSRIQNETDNHFTRTFTIAGNTSWKSEHRVLHSGMRDFPLNYLNSWVIESIIEIYANNGIQFDVSQGKGIYPQGIYRPFKCYTEPFKMVCDKE